MEPIISGAHALLAEFDGNRALAVLGLLHFFGLALALPGVALGDALGVRMLLFSGGAVSQRAVSFAHGLVFAGLCLLLMSGTALAVIHHDPASFPPKLLAKASIVAVLCLNALTLQHELLPLARFGLRPLAVTLPVGHLIRAITIGTISLAAWLSILAIALIEAVGQRSYWELIAGFAVLWAVLFAGASLTALGLRAISGWRNVPGRDGQRTDADDAYGRDGPMLDMAGERIATLGEVERRVSASAPEPVVIQAGDVASLGERLARLTGMPPVNDNPREPAGARIPFGEFAGHPNAVSPAPASMPRALRGDRRDGRPPHSESAVPEPLDDSRPARREREAKGGEPESYAWREVRQACRRAVLAVCAISFVTNMLMLTGPLFMLQVYDRVLTSKSLPTLTALFALAVALFAFMGVLEALRNRLLVRIGLRIDRLLSRQIFSAAILPQNAEARAQSVQHLRDVRHIRQFVGGSGAAAVFDMPWAPFYFALLFLFHPLLGVVAVAGALVLVALAILNAWFSADPAGEAARHGAEGERLAEAGRRNDEIARAMGMGPNLSERWLESHAREALSQTKGADVAGGFGVAIKTTRLILQSGILAAGAYLVLAGSVTAGIMIAASIILSRALAPIETVVGGWRALSAAREGGRRLARAFAEAPTAPARLRLTRPQGRLDVEGIYAAAPGTADPVLKGLSFALEPGEALGVLGASGAGKSALARVLVGVWPTVRGDVRLDGAALSHWPPEQLGGHVGYVPQTAELLDGTVAENIARFDRDAPPEEIMAAARMANVHDMIQTLPEGYNTRVGAGGTVLSGGQRQRVALARALYRQPALLVLDEPNQNLDAAGERALNAAIATARRAGSAVVVLTNRRKLLEAVDLLLVLKDGRQVAFGPKEEVLSAPEAAGGGGQASRAPAAGQRAGRLADVAR